MWTWQSTALHQGASAWCCPTRAAGWKGPGQVQVGQNQGALCDGWLTAGYRPCRESPHHRQGSNITFVVCVKLLYIAISVNSCSTLTMSVLVALLPGFTSTPASFPQKARVVISIKFCGKSLRLKVTDMVSNLTHLHYNVLKLGQGESGSQECSSLSSSPA